MIMNSGPAAQIVAAQTAVVVSTELYLKLVW